MGVQWRRTGPVRFCLAKTRGARYHMNLITALQQLYPEAQPLRDYTIVDRGSGPFLADWTLTTPRPTMIQLLAVGYDGPYLTPQEAHMASREQEFITKVRAANKQIWEGPNTLKALQREWTALDYGATLDAGSGDNAGVAAAEVGAVLFDTANAFEGVLNAGHATNMAKLL